MTYRNFEEWVLAAEVDNLTLAEVVLQSEIELTEKSEKQIKEKLMHRWQVMQKSAHKALAQPQQMVGGLISGQAKKQSEYAVGASLCGNMTNRAMAMAFSCSEVNASMGRVCAAPTAGACGVLPAVLTTVAQEKASTEAEIKDALLVAAGVGGLITQNATVSGAAAGCQAECGAAAAMAAAAAVTLCGGTVAQVGNAVSITLMNCMGLVCDPVAGLVQMPCSYRNASQAVNALLSADMALAGQDAIIPPDEVIDAMYKVGKRLPPELRETALGGIATTPTGERIRKKILEGRQ